MCLASCLPCTCVPHKGRNMLNDVMTVSEVAEYLRVNPQTVYRKAKAGEMPVVRIGRAIRFRRTELETWLKHPPAEGRRIAGTG